MAHNERVVLLVDMDCFYCQVEEKLNPALKGHPMAVVQYNAWQGGGIIAVNYQARDRGVTRHMRGNEAKKHCPEIELVRVPNVRGKADLTKYRNAGKAVANVLQRFSLLLERASVDEAYLDISELVKQRMESSTKDITQDELKNTFTVGGDKLDFLYNLYNNGLQSESNLRLAHGGVIAEEVRAAVFEETGYTCSAGISHNKILAKLACGLNKPNKQTILPSDSIQELYKDLPVRKIRSLGGKFGITILEDLNITNMGELIKFSMKELTKRYDDKTALFLYNIARGIDLEPVTTRLVSKSIGCCKKFPGKNALVNSESVKHWLHELALEVSERLEKDFEENNRKSKQMVVSFSQDVKGKEVSSSRTHPLKSYNPQQITKDAFEVIKKFCLKSDGSFGLKFLGLNVGKFEDCKNVNEITSFFKVKTDVHNELEVCNTPAGQEESNLKTVHESGNYSDSTLELDEDSSEMKFMDEASNLPNEENLQKEDSDNDSISNELCDKSMLEPQKNLNQSNSDHDSINNEPCDDSMIEHEKNSFFLNYFKNKKAAQLKVARDFNTSRILEELSDEDESNSNYVDSVAGPSHRYEEEVEICDECNESVTKGDLISHKDHHFATKLLQEEKDAAKKNNSVVMKPKLIKSPKKEVKKSKKRKASVANNSTLERYFKNEEPSGVNTELCSQCNKNISVEEFLSHLDYHAAKKLHLEINPSAVIAKKSTIQHPKETKNGTKSVMSFFKPFG